MNKFSKKQIGEPNPYPSIHNIENKIPMNKLY